MATYNVHMMTQPEEWTSPRPVTVPDEHLKNTASPEGEMALLEHIFYFGQNEFAVVPVDGCCSVSMGDVAEIDGTLYLCKAMGWGEISQVQFEAYKAIGREDRTFSELMRS